MHYVQKNNNKEQLFFARLPGISANSNKNFKCYNFQVIVKISGKFTTLQTTQTTDDKRTPMLQSTNSEQWPLLAGMKVLTMPLKLLVAHTLSKLSASQRGQNNAYNARAPSSGQRDRLPINAANFSGGIIWSATVCTVWVVCGVMKRWRDNRRPNQASIQVARHCAQ